MILRVEAMQWLDRVGLIEWVGRFRAMQFYIRLRSHDWVGKVMQWVGGAKKSMREGISIYII